MVVQQRESMPQFAPAWAVAGVLLRVFAYSYSVPFHQKNKHVVTENYNELYFY